MKPAARSLAVSVSFLVAGDPDTGTKELYRDASTVSGATNFMPRIVPVDALEYRNILYSIIDLLADLEVHMESLLAYQGGELTSLDDLSVSIRTHALQYGTGVFEDIRAWPRARR
jgi:hypothetical protein